MVFTASNGTTADNSNNGLITYKQNYWVTPVSSLGLVPTMTYPLMKAFINTTNLSISSFTQGANLGITFADTTLTSTREITTKLHLYKSGIMTDFQGTLQT